MNKLPIAAAAALVVVVLALPAVVGFRTEGHVRERVAAIDASSTAAARVTAFERGWFHSSAKIELSLAPDASQFGSLPAGVAAVPMATTPLAIAVEFAHGPVAALDGVYLGWSKWVARLDTDAPGVLELQQTLGVPYVFEFRGRTGFGGNLTFDADAPAFDLPIDQALLKFSGATFDGTFDRGRALAARMHVPGLDFTSPTGTVLVNNLRASADNEILSRYVMPGAATFSIESVAISDAFQGGPVFEAANFQVSSNTTLDTTGALLDTHIAYGLDSMRVAESVVTAATIEMRVRNLDVAALEAYGAAVDDIANPVDPMTALGPHLERALKAGPSLAFDPIRFELDAEPFEGRVAMTAQAERVPQAGTIDLDNPLFILGLIDTTADVRLSKALAQNLAELMARMQLGGDGSVAADELENLAEAQAGLTLTLLVGQGVLVEDGDAYRSSLEFSNGALTLNGSPLPFGLP